MARRRFFASAAEGGKASITGPGAAHLARVLRARPGEEHEIAWQGAVYLGRIEQVQPHAVTFALERELATAAPVPDLEVGAALFNTSHWEWMLEKATELGLTRLWPLLTRRTDPRWALGAPAGAAKRRARWQQIALQAAEQSRRATVPDIAAPLTLQAFLALPAAGARWLLQESPGGVALPPSLPCRLLAGPEGGWEEEESSAATAAGYVPVSLGPRILRCETAVIAALVLAGH
ncbi:MAG: RsmE family RNA methyltransferase [Terriglobales bacterium]